MAAVLLSPLAYSQEGIEPIDLSNQYQKYQQQMEPMPADWWGRAGKAKRKLKGVMQDNLKSVGDAALQNGTLVYSYQPGLYFEIFTKKGFIVDVMLEPGEFVKEGISIGDNDRWIINLAISGEGFNQRQHIYITPKYDHIMTQLVIPTNKRSYHLLLSAAKSFYSPSVAWSYPIPMKAQKTEAKEAEQAKYYGYTISPKRGFIWEPQTVYDNGRQTFFVFDAGLKHRAMPIIYVVDQDNLELVNFRVKGTTLIVPRLADHFHVAIDDKRSVNVSRSGTDQPRNNKPLQFGGRGKLNINLRDEIGKR